jgi:Rod binding domain-containing protein
MALKPVQEFQALFIKQMIDRLWATTQQSGSMAGTEYYRDLASQALARQMVASGFTFGQALEEAVAKATGPAK